ncbi:hypothetical protein Y032_0646g1091 [Ancylostoma ceylanicum]|uniref:Uncharacterized protein n=1 Tax=Ancylostoma ceylanicum TaxID=53326 RepID=A0A016WJ53_9BILA|nr:hypothetical protein Y032_0646g1091 [Ancylostoma ceylanicum]
MHILFPVVFLVRSTKTTCTQTAAPPSGGKSSGADHKPSEDVATAKEIVDKPTEDVNTAKPIDDKPSEDVKTAQSIPDEPTEGVNTAKLASDGPTSGVSTAQGIMDKPTEGVTTAKEVGADKPSEDVNTAKAIGEPAMPGKPEQVSLFGFCRYSVGNEIFNEVSLIKIHEIFKSKSDSSGEQGSNEDKGSKESKRAFHFNIF